MSITKTYFPLNYNTNFWPQNFWPKFEELIDRRESTKTYESGGGSYFYKPIDSIFDNEEDKPTVDEESEEIIILKMISMLDAIKEKPRKKKAVTENNERQIIELIDNLASIKKSYSEEDNLKELLYIISVL